MLLSRPCLRCLLVMVFVTSCFLGVSQTAMAQSDGVRLTWKWKPGEKLSVETEQDISTSMVIGGQDMGSTNTTRTSMTWDVVEADSEGVAIVSSTIDRISVDVTSAMANLKFDSDDDNDDGGPQVEMLAGRLRPMIGAVTKQKMNSRGEVLSLEFDDELKASLKEMGGEATVKMFEEVSRNATLTFPEEPLKVGDSWEKEIVSASAAGEMTLISTYTYRGEETIDSKSLHKFDVDVNMSFGEGTVTVDEQTTTGELFFDAEAGRIDHSRVEQKINMTIRQGGQEIKQTMNQIATITIKPAK